MIANAWNIARRELSALYTQPIAYIFAIAMLFITGLIFSGQIAIPIVQGGPPASVEAVLGLFTFLGIFTVPAVTMRLLSEEFQSGTIELLMTLPVRDGEVVLGKFLAALIVYIITTALTLIFVFILFRFGNPDTAVILTGYLGAILWGAGLIGIGLLASALANNQITAFMLAFGINLGLYLSFIVGEQFPGNTAITTIFNELSYQSHLPNLLRGLITATDVLYYVAITAVTLFATTRILESRRWR